MCHQLEAKVMIAFGIAGLTLLLQPAANAQSGDSNHLIVHQADSEFRLSLNDGDPFHTTADEICDARLLEVADTSVIVVVWDERDAVGTTRPFYGLGMDGEIFRVRPTSYDLKLKHTTFDPAVGVPAIDPNLAATANSSVYIVQFFCQPLQTFRDAIGSLGGNIYQFLPNHSYVVNMTPSVRDLVAELPYVRWIGPFHPAYRVSSALRSELVAEVCTDETRRYAILVFERGPAQQDSVANMIDNLGGTVHLTTPGGFRMVATLTLSQLRSVIGMDEVRFAGIAGEPATAMDLARDYSGADFLQGVTGYTGQGVRGEIMDTGLLTTHQDFSPAPLMHGYQELPLRHGTSVYGIVFGTGWGSSPATGVLPDGEGVFATWYPFSEGYPGRDQYTHTCQLLDDPTCCDPQDPNCPYEAVFQTNSWLWGYQTDYGDRSFEIDDIVFQYELIFCQAQGNCGDPTRPTCNWGGCSVDTCSGPEAWAKNVISVGGFYHQDTLDKSDDQWASGAAGISWASTGPAEDGRVKPDLIHFYDAIYTTCVDGTDCYRDGANAPRTPFSGTSAATPITCGYAGLLTQMWHEGVFPGFGGGSSVFDSRPHMSTAKAMLINTAYRYPLTQADFTRYNQGWGVVDVEKLYSVRNKMFIIDETYVLSNLVAQKLDVTVVVPSGEPELLVTIVFTDPPGNLSAEVDRINDLSLKVTSPSGDVYWGNHGLMSDNCSVMDASPSNRDTINTVENVFVCPLFPATEVEAGDWVVTVSADEISQDSHLETTMMMDADFALAVTGVSDIKGACCPQPFGTCFDTTPADCQQQGGVFGFDRTCATLHRCVSQE